MIVNFFHKKASTVEYSTIDNFKIKILNLLVFVHTLSVERDRVFLNVNMVVRLQVGVFIVL